MLILVKRLSSRRPTPVLSRGVPGLKSIGSLDPLLVKRITIQHNQSPLVVDATLSDIAITGLGNAQVQDTQLDLGKLVSSATIFVPKFTMNSDYNAKGQILGLPLNSNGKLTLSAEKFAVHITMKLKLRDEGGFTFTDIEKLHLDITSIGGFTVYMGNLFNGQKELEDSANALFNENWRELYQILNPAIRQSVETVMLDRIGKVYAFVPANFLVADIPSAAAYYG
ncbi:circadian clock-controlled protein daywake-like [Musca vetustissima]|uniref:circadian clock-controlled protein daywake-like n=1 Tax=Musca vetustissima TaxID=27455 RepID=UPI002AB74B16|nr:circadian clock-controlled protein daywake-like [Musca vetustissima]